MNDTETETDSDNVILTVSLILLLVFIFLTGVNTTKLNQYQITQLSEHISDCKDNGGFDHFSINKIWFGTTNFYLNCQDGTSFKMKPIKEWRNNEKIS